MTYITIGVKLVGVARYGARVVVLKDPLFSSDWLSGLNVMLRFTYVDLEYVALPTVSCYNDRFCSSQ